MLGTEDNDSLMGLAGEDTLSGLGGDDILNGGMDTDVLVGGAGADQFNFIPGEGWDIVSDFQNGQDVIGLGGNISFSQLEIVPYAGHTWIWSNVTSEWLGVLVNTDSSVIGAEDFVALV